MTKIYSDQEPRTTAVYVDGARVAESAIFLLTAEEKLLMAPWSKTHALSSRVVFGSGRVALVMQRRDCL